MQIKKGNYTQLEIGPITDANGDTLTNLSTATEVYYMLKIKPTDDDSDAVLTKQLTAGVTVDDPSTGYITVEIESDDYGSVNIGNYYQGLKIEYSTTNRQEVNLSESGEPIDMVEITQNVIGGS